MCSEKKTLLYVTVFFFCFPIT
uniref:Uncharacterized protein n=1 Tax=Anguilla anguilla TaxID=7936 RepID=A0A0E9SDD1_ANGAN